MSSLTSSVHGVPISSAWVNTSYTIVPALLLDNILHASRILLSLISDFIVFQPRSSCNVWLAGSYEVLSIYRANFLMTTFISCLSSSIASSSQASVPYRKTDLTHALAICSCLLIGRFGSRFKMVLTLSDALVA